MKKTIGEHMVELSQWKYVRLALLPLTAILLGMHWYLHDTYPKLFTLEIGLHLDMTAMVIAGVVIALEIMHQISLYLNKEKPL